MRSNSPIRASCAEIRAVSPSITPAYDSISARSSSSDGCSTPRTPHIINTPAAPGHAATHPEIAGRRPEWLRALGPAGRSLTPTSVFHRVDDRLGVISG